MILALARHDSTSSANSDKLCGGLPTPRCEAASGNVPFCGLSRITVFCRKAWNTAAAEAAPSSCMLNNACFSASAREEVLPIFAYKPGVGAIVDSMVEASNSLLLVGWCGMLTVDIVVTNDCESHDDPRQCSTRPCDISVKRVSQPLPRRFKSF